MHGRKSWKATCNSEGRVSPGTGSELSRPPAARQSRLSRLSCLHPRCLPPAGPQATCRCARTLAGCQTLFKGPPPLGWQMSAVPALCSRSCRRLAGLGSHPAAGAAAGAWAPRSSSGLSSLSSRQGSSVSWEGEHGGRESSRAGKTSVRRRKAGIQSAKVGTVPDAYLSPLTLETPAISWC